MHAVHRIIASNISINKIICRCYDEGGQSDNLNNEMVNLEKS